MSFSSAFSPNTAKKRGVKKGSKKGAAQPQVTRELRLTRDSLQQTLDELQTSNEELKSTNEELQSTNEELQSTNEELETSKEELQSLNEELQTVNSELQVKNDELAQVNDDMQNLLNGTEIATLFLDRELRIKRFTEQARRVVRLISTDVGRPIADLVQQVRYDHLSEDALEVLRTLKPHEAEAQALDGRWLLVRILPYRTSQDRIEGVVITFVDIDRVKHAESLAASRELAESIVQTVRAPLLVLDTELRVVTTNRAFLRLLQLEQADIRAISLFELAGGVFALPALRNLLEALLAQGVPIQAFEFSHEFEGGAAGRMQLNARRLEKPGVASGHVLLALQAVNSGDSAMSP
jgi:two-component system CheB/CheR fusion protein